MCRPVAQLSNAPGTCHDLRAFIKAFLFSHENQCFGEMKDILLLPYRRPDGVENSRILVA
ncbi:hypothetical protein M408DRAFT_196590 [Serendipita vermifera MAFF 305830]|uniref:Uncharacterized protein n=1 Tax=Serendipita vermifera MAFF 305830 TaxID=933852 RepID=A0A0C3B3T3_SERVB|nr:hypothetical protein M408DRAFT_196590 [Serendipita vermifera MAFF 305830]